MNKKKYIILTFAKYLLFILLPPIFINVYYLYDTYSTNKLNNFDYNNILFPTIIRAIIICLFIILLLELGKRIKHILICPIVIILHLIFCALFNLYPSYFMYVEVLSGLLLAVALIPIDYIRRHKQNPFIPSDLQIYATKASSKKVMPFTLRHHLFF